ncbi:hypothetical protein ICN84_11995 [Akkermansia glycaniphila]|uniref:hypothetical protein n=1 Tax=Akkermansia glycaniphila TaxID=1679444 RepID=UPI001C00A737|nr:hypothetical protein [Akkermansia glycaniphila]MBT9450789.1 hypothetical protein [Akkermansia glycaniphila]
MTLRLVQSYGAPIPNEQYIIDGTVIQDEMVIPISATTSAAHSILLTIPPLAPGNHPYTLKLRNVETNTAYTILQGNCQVTELIDADTLDTAAIEQITATQKEDLVDFSVTVQIAPDITAAALNAVSAASGIINDIRKTAELETAKAVAAIGSKASEAIANVGQTGQTACSAVQSAATAGQNAIQTAQTTATTEITTAKNNALAAISNSVETGKTTIDTAKNAAVSTITGATTTGKNEIQTAQAKATAAIATAKNEALQAIADAVETGQAQFDASINAILANPDLIARLKTACGIPALETAIAGKVDASDLNAYIPYAKLGRALTKASDGKVDVDLSNYSGTTVNIIGTTSACIGRSSSECFEITSNVAQIRHNVKSEIVRGNTYINVMTNQFTLDTDWSNANHAYIRGTTSFLDIQAYDEIAMRSNRGNYPGLCINGEHAAVIVRKNSATSRDQLAYFGNTGTAITYYTNFYNGHN